jgi:UDP-N-acetylmuramate: L-alanyl-gamma-D-glutamyl-meso-diaminopimelate ligase
MIGCWDYSVVRDLMAQSLVPVISYGSSLKTQARFTPGDVRIESDWTRFKVLDEGKIVDEIAIQIPGHHNVLNALSVWIECQQLGIDSKQVCKALQSFRGVKRRQEVCGEVGGIVVIDDFAHHPTAVRETLRALKSKYSNRRVITVFEPRSATSRRKVFQNDYASALNESDLIFISSPYDQTKISSDDQFSSETLVQDLITNGRRAFLMRSVDQGIQEISEIARSGDLIAVLSNGGFGGLIGKLLQELQLRQRVSSS